MSRLHSILIGAALAAATGLAQAQALSTVTAELTSIRVQLIDLTPDDGQAPSLGPGAGGFLFTRLQSDVRWTLAPTYIDQQFSYEQFSAAPPSTTGAVSLDAAGISGRAERGADWLSARVTGGEGLSTQSYAGWEVSPIWSAGGTLLTGSFELGAGTAVTLSADYQLFGHIAAGHPGQLWAGAILHGMVGTGDLGQLQRSQYDVLLSAPGEETAAGSLLLTLSNPTDTAVPVFFGAHASTYTDVMPVPEPGTLTLLLAGGVLVAWRARRRMSPG